MKKLLFTGLVFVFLFGGGSNVYALEGDWETNVLDMRNLIVHDGMAMTRDVILVEDDEIYTLVLSFGVLGEYYSRVETMNLVIDDDEGSVERPYQKDRIRKMAYVEFLTSGDWIHLEAIPIDPTECHQAMLFKGKYDDFSGFEPFISGNREFHGEETIELPYETELSLADIEAFMIAYGPDYEPVEYVTKRDEYSTGNKLPGMYVLTFESTYFDLISTFDLFIHVIDDKAPEIIGESEYVFEFANRPMRSEIMEHLIVEDNVDELGHDDFVFITDTYTDASEPGTYRIVFKVSDSSGNETVKEIEVTLLDSDGPIVDGTDIIFIYTEDDPLTHDEILSHYHVYDEIDGDDVYYGIDYDTYQGTRIPGVYLVSIRAIDNTGNQTTHYIEIHVINNSPVRFEIGDVELLTTVDDTLSEDDLIAFMRDTLVNLGYAPSSIMITYDDYSARSDEKGTYYVYFDYEIDDESYQTRLAVSVEDDGHEMIAYALVGIVVLGGLGIVIIRKRR